MAIVANSRMSDTNRVKELWVWGNIHNLLHIFLSLKLLSILSRLFQKKNTNKYVYTQGARSIEHSLRRWILHVKTMKKLEQTRALFDPVFEL